MLSPLLRSKNQVWKTTAIIQLLRYFIISNLKAILAKKAVTPTSWPMPHIEKLSFRITLITTDVPKPGFTAVPNDSIV